jgi:DNA-binding NarL/FixJ family response regulator
MDKAFNTVRVLIVDDHPVVRFGLQQMLVSEDDMTVVGEVDSIDQLVATVQQATPDVVILDLELGDTHGTIALQTLRQAAPDVRILVYTAHADDERILQAAESGMNGYLLKGCPKDQLVEAIRSVHAGGTVIDPNVASRLMQHMYKQTGSNGGKQETKQLSERETEVLACLAEGKSNNATARALYICEATVKFHVHAILGKLKASNRTEAVMIGIQMGLISQTPNT